LNNIADKFEYTLILLFDIVIYLCFFYIVLINSYLLLLCK